ncbi:hypothetical protein MPER_06639, partial [Moniliophthora perniciosa FA553]
SHHLAHVTPYIWSYECLSIFENLSTFYVDQPQCELDIGLFFVFMFTTGQLYNPRPSFPICLVQASAIYAVPSLTSGATLAVAISLFLRIRSTGTQGREIDPQVQRMRTLALVLTPYILPTVIFFGVLIFGLRHKEQVILADNWMFCGLKDPVFARAADLLVAAIMVPTATIGVWIIIYLYRSTAESLGRKIVHLLAKLSIFTLFGIFGVMHLAERHGKRPACFTSIIVHFPLWFAKGA